MDHGDRLKRGWGNIADTMQGQIGAKEQEIRELREEIRGLREEIRSREQEVRSKEQELRGVENEIAIASGAEVRVALQAKLQFQRQEVISIRQDISSLDQQISSRDQQICSRDQQISILWQEVLALAGTLTWTEWYCQRLPLPLFSFSTSPGLRQAKSEYVPASTIGWDLWLDVDQYIADAITKPSRPKRIDIEAHVKSIKEVSSEADCCYIYQALLVRIGSVLLGDEFSVSAEKWTRSSPMMQQPTIADITRGALNDSSAVLNSVSALANTRFASGGRTDILLKCTGRVFLVVKMKKPSFLRIASDQNPPDLVKAYEDKDLEYLDGRRSHVLAQSITQLFRYLVRYQIGYGIISSGDLSYLASRVGDSLRISEGIEWRHPKFIGALAYIMEKAADDTTVYKWEGGDRHPQVYGIDNRQGTQDSLTDHEDHEESDASKKLKMTQTDRSVTRSMTGVSGLKETPAAHLHLEALPFATGWSGNIVRGVYEGHAVAVKLAVVCSDRAEALINEASVYLKLQKYWGRYVPALLSHGTTADGNVVYIATKLINGYELGMESLTQEVVTASFEALNAIHASGVLHGDIRRDNILVPKGRRRGVRFIDFGFARSIASAEDCCKERAQLQDIISQFRSNRPVRVPSTAGHYLEAEAN